MSDCLFCKVVNGEIEADIVADDDAWTAFRDINPQAPTHILVIPKKHIATVNDLRAEDGVLVGELVRAAGKIANDEGIAGAIGFSHPFAPARRQAILLASRIGRLI